MNRDVPAWAVWMIGAILLGGCGKPDAPAPTTSPAAAQPAVLNVGGEPVTFAVPTLEVVRDAGALLVTLAGNDGQSPSRQSFYFSATFDTDNPADLPGQVWRFQRPEGEEVDGAAGVFMEGNSLRFLPVDLQIDFAGKWPDLTVALKGKLLRDGDESKPVTLSGTYAVRATETRR